jgi:hypothetical protein
VSRCRLWGVDLWNSGNLSRVAEHLLSYRTNTGRFSASSAACLLGCFFKGKTFQTEVAPVSHQNSPARGVFSRFGDLRYRSVSIDFSNMPDGKCNSPLRWETRWPTSMKEITTACWTMKRLAEFTTNTLTALCHRVHACTGM